MASRARSGHNGNDGQERADTTPTTGDDTTPTTSTVDTDTEVIDAEVISGPGAPGAVAVRDTADGAGVEGYIPASYPALEALNVWLTEYATVANVADIAVDDIVRQVLTASTVDEVLADVSAIGMREMLNTPMRIHAVKAHRSTYELGSPHFFWCDVEILTTGARIGVTTGAQTVMAQIVRMVMLNSLPADVVPVLATKRPTANGHWPYRLSRAPIRRPAE